MTTVTGATLADAAEHAWRRLASSGLGPPRRP